MVVFTLSCFGILLFLWLAFGGSIPLRPEAYRFQAAFPEAATLWRSRPTCGMAGVNVGKVKKKELEKGAGTDDGRARAQARSSRRSPRTPRAILRQKTLLGETYVELRSTGDQSATNLAAMAGRCRWRRWSRRWSWTRSSMRSTSRRGMAFQEWVRELSSAIKGGRWPGSERCVRQSEGRSRSMGRRCCKELDEQEVAVRRSGQEHGCGVRGDQSSARARWAI